MFAVMYETEEGKVIKTCKELDEAHELANNTACMGYAVTVFDYDADSQTFLEFYSMKIQLSPEQLKSPGERRKR